MAMNPIDIEVLGFSQEELQERVIERIADRALSGFALDDDGDGFSERTGFAEKLDSLIRERIDEAVAALAEKHVLPRVQELIENWTLKETNRWGEAKKEPLTFTEYLVQRAEHYMTEEVNHSGKSRSQDSFNFRGAQSRIVWMIDEHIQYHISTAVKNALDGLNGAVADGLAKTVRAQTAEILGKLKIETKVGR